MKIAMLLSTLVGWWTLLLLSVFGFPLVSSVLNQNLVKTTCEREYFDDLKKTFMTCYIDNQEIYSNNYLISNNRDESVEFLTLRKNKNVEFLPANIAVAFPNLLELDAISCSIEEIEEKYLKNLLKLKKLRMDKNYIWKIDSNAFADLRELTELHLTYNSIEFLSPAWFRSLKQLKILYLSHNRIGFINSDSLESLVSIETLYCDNNKIKYLEPHSFANLPHLRNLILTDNEIEEITEGLFRTNRKLEKILLQRNELKFVHSEAFDGLKKLLILTMTTNPCDGSFNGEKEKDIVKLGKFLKEKCSDRENLRNRWNVRICHEARNEEQCSLNPGKPTNGDFVNFLKTS